MADYAKAKRFHQGISDAIRVGLGTKQPDQGKKFVKKYSEAFKDLLEAHDDDAIKHAVRPFTNEMAQAVDMYQADPTDPEAHKGIVKALAQITLLRNGYLGELTEAQLAHEFTTGEKTRYQELVTRVVEEAKKNGKASTLLDKLDQ